MSDDLQLRLQGQHICAAAQTQAVEAGQVENGAFHLVGLVHTGHPGDGFQRVVQEMGLDLCLQSGDLTLAQLFLGAFLLADQNVDAIQHGVMLPYQHADFILGLGLKPLRRDVFQGTSVLVIQPDVIIESADARCGVPQDRQGAEHSHQHQQHGDDVHRRGLAPDDLIEKIMVYGQRHSPAGTGQTPVEDRILIIRQTVELKGGEAFLFLGSHLFQRHGAGSDASGGNAAALRRLQTERQELTALRNGHDALQRSRIDVNAQHGHQLLTVIQAANGGDQCRLVGVQLLLGEKVAPAPAAERLLRPFLALHIVEHQQAGGAVKHVQRRVHI